MFFKFLNEWYHYTLSIETSSPLCFQYEHKHIIIFKITLVNLHIIEINTKFIFSILALHFIYQSITCNTVWEAVTMQASIFFKWYFCSFLIGFLYHCFYYQKNIQHQHLQKTIRHGITSKSTLSDKNTMQDNHDLFFKVLA